MSSVPHIVVAPTTLGTATITATKQLDVEAKWLGMEILSWTDQDGRKRGWEVATRKTTSAGGVDAVAIAAILRHPSKPVSIPIILQYRPPIGSVCVELPAGLIDASESASTAALRELHEETGYGGPAFEGRVKVFEVGSVVWSDPGMTRANMHLMTVDVQLAEGEELPTPKLEDGEHIEVRITPLKELYEHLQAYEALGYRVDARLHHYAAGIHAAQRLGL